MYFEVIYTSSKHDRTDAFTNAKNESQDLSSRNVPEHFSGYTQKCEDKVTHPLSKYCYLQGATKQPLCLNTTGLFMRRETRFNFSSWSCRGIWGRQKVIIQLEFGQDTGVSTAALAGCVRGLCNDHQHCLLSHERHFPQNPGSPWKSPIYGLSKPSPSWFGNNAGQGGRAKSITISVTFKSSKIYMD